MGNNIFDQPISIKLITGVAGYLSSSEYTSFSERFKNAKKFMPSIIITYIFNNLLR